MSLKNLPNEGNSKWQMYTGSYFVTLNSGGWIRFPRQLRYFMYLNNAIGHLNIVAVKDDPALFWLVSDVIAIPKDGDLLVSSCECEFAVKGKFDKMKNGEIKLRIPIELRKSYDLSKGAQIVLLGCEDRVEVWREEEFNLDA